jgi:hypothetical protein
MGRLTVIGAFGVIRSLSVGEKSLFVGLGSMKPEFVFGAGEFVSVAG